MHRVWTFVALVGLACSSLPEFAAPRRGAAEPGALTGGDLIRYRALTRSDFRGAAPPGESAAHAEQLGALTCTHIATTPGTAYEITETVRGQDRSYSVRFSRLGFVAHMDRRCSWWNPKGDPKDASYVLQHEQIHFGLAEAEARRTNREAREILTSWSERASSPEDAKAMAEEKVRSLVNAATDNLLDVSEDFDEDTSAKHSPERQNAWEARVNQELSEFARYKNP